ncbi:MAG TPA: RagB/SusD family nutrient uptake outer membrane protein [Longimicrobium sp.]|nr:RagB/SusD family nutrient uptake outer membrane protein [Longimicrobium sp.]
MKLKVLAILAAASLAACDDPLNVNPQQSIPQDEALNSAEEIRVGVNGMYDALQSCDGAYCRNTIIYPDLYVDNLRYSGTYTTDSEVWGGDVRANNSGVTDIWEEYYDAINRANNVIVSLPGVADLAAGEAPRFEGEARFVRALSYLNLVNFFGGVPLITAPVWQAGEGVNVARSSEAETWALIESDLNTAIGLLPTARSAGRANRAAAQALLARAHLYQREWAQARALANTVIGNTAYSLVPEYADIFEKEQSAESLFELPFTVTDGNSLAFWFYPRALGGRYGVAPSNATTESRPITGIFSAGDKRAPLAFRSGGGRTYAAKYTIVATGEDDVIVLRLAEMYLIRSEANARLNALAPAIADINVIRARAGVGPLAADIDTQEEVLIANLEERRREFFYEGHRFWDLRRFRDIPSVGTYLGINQGISGGRLLFPIPQRELDANSALVQNPGY